MSLPILISLVTTVVFGSLAIYFSIREELLRKSLRERDELQKRRLYEISVLKAIQDRIGYSLDVERVIDTLTGSLKSLFPYSTSSSLLLHEETMLCKLNLEERVSSQFLEQVKKSMLASLAGLVDRPLPQHMEELRTGLIPDETNSSPLSSFFHIPLIVNGAVVGLISICSTKPGLYKDEDMTILYQLTAAASNALSRLRDVIAIEQEKMLAMITSLSDGILMIDKDYTLTLINQAAKDFLSIPHVTKPTIFDAVNMLSKTTDFGAKIKESLLQDKVIQQEEVQLENKTVQVVITPVHGPKDPSAGSGQVPTKQDVLGVTVLLHDITLEKSLGQMKEDFTNAVVHELRSPLTAIKAAAEMMVGEENLEMSQKRLLTIIDEQSKRMINDINSLLDAAKLESGTFTLYQNPYSLKDIVQKTIELYTPIAQRKQIQLQSFVEETLPPAFVDSTRIEQVLNNLLGNSLKYTKEGGTITIKAVSQYSPQLPTTPTNPGILVSVTDTGIGIPQERQKEIFQKFIQVHQDNKALSEGTGLGLYIAKGIVVSHGGNMYVNSAQGRGTTIFFTLPVAHEEKKPLLNPKLQEVLERYTPKVLN